MSERVSSTALETIRATLARSGGTSRPEVRLPAENDHTIDADVVHLTVEDTSYHAPVVSVADSIALRGAYRNPRRAREREGEEYLSAWLEASELEFGRTVLLDVINPGVQYGLRAPGEEAVYRLWTQPDTDLQDIARSLE